MKLFGRIFEAMVQSRQLQADRIVRASANFAQQAREYDLHAAAEKAHATSGAEETTGSLSMPIKGLAA
jgi:hypothetical protein